MNIQQKVSAEGEVMAEKLSINTAGIMAERFGKDTLISLATVDNGEPQVRTVDGYYGVLYPP